jgi:hypothetical protein
MDSRAESWFGQSFEHDADHCEAHESGDGSGVAFEVARQPAISADPREGPFNDPAFWQDDEAMCVAAFDDLQSPAAGVGDHLGHLRPLIARISKDALNKRKPAPRRAQQLTSTIAILHVGRVDDYIQQKAERVDEDMALAARNLLARIEALWVKRRAPF